MEEITLNISGFDARSVHIGQRVDVSGLGWGTVMYVSSIYDVVVGYTVFFDVKPPMDYNGGANPCFVPVGQVRGYLPLGAGL